MESTKCKCGKPRASKHRYCLDCKAAYMREWRKTNPLSDEQKRRQNARSYANVYKKRGKLKPQPCRVCGNPNSEAHHDDYNKPLEVTWLCRTHHLEHHQKMKA